MRGVTALAVLVAGIAAGAALALLVLSRADLGATAAAAPDADRVADGTTGEPQAAPATDD